MKEKPGWRFQNVRDTRVMGYPLRKAASREWSLFKIKNCVVVEKANRSWSSEECFDIRHGDRVWSLSCWFLVLLWSSISSLFSLSSLLEYQCVFCVIVCWKYVICFSILILQGITAKKLLSFEFQKRLWTLDF